MTDPRLVLVVVSVPQAKPRLLRWPGPSRSIRYPLTMDHEWAANQLDNFKKYIDALGDFSYADGAEYDDLIQEFGTSQDVADYLVTKDPVMRELMEATQPELGLYQYPDQGGWGETNPRYWRELVRPRVLRAIGIHRFGAEARRRMQPDSPELIADQLHPWVWDAAMPLWLAGSRQEAVQAAARSVNARIQQKLERRDIADAALCREAFSLKEPGVGRSRLRFSGDRTSETWRSRQTGGIDFGAGCFEGIRNPVSHEHELNLPEMVALEYLAAFSILARWIEECAVEHASERVPTAGSDADV